MIWHKRYVRPTALERIRSNAARKAGCILSAYRREKKLPVPSSGKTDLHHLKDGNKRMSEVYTIPLHSWYHERVVPYPCESIEEARARYGASLKDGSKAFVASHGITERGLWEMVQTRMGMSTEWPASKIFKRELETEAEVTP